MSHHHHCDDPDCEHEHAPPSIDEVLQYVAALSLILSRADLEGEIADAVEAAPEAKRRAARRESMASLQDEHWEMQDVPKSQAVAFSPALRDAFRLPLGGWRDREFDLAVCTQASLASILWALGEIDAPPTPDDCGDPETTSAAIERINGKLDSQAAITLRAQEEIERELQRVDLLLERGTFGRGESEGDSDGEEPQQRPFDGAIRAEFLARASDLGIEVVDDDIGLRGETFAAWPDERVQAVVEYSIARAEALEWLLRGGDRPPVEW